MSLLVPAPLTERQSLGLAGEMKSSPSNVRILNAAVIVAALGYFVDIYDLILFSIVRVPSLKALGLEGQELFDQGVRLLNMQMFGMLLGGILWGILGDKRGRLSVLFGSTAAAERRDGVTTGTTAVTGVVEDSFDDEPSATAVALLPKNATDNTTWGSQRKRRRVTPRDASCQVV